MPIYRGPKHLNLNGSGISSNSISDVLQHSDVLS